MVGAYGIKVTQNRDVPAGVAGTEVLQDLLDHIFGLAVRVGNADAGAAGFL